MDAKEEGRIIGKLEEGFKSLEKRLDAQDKKHEVMEAAINEINLYKARVTARMSLILGAIVGIFESIRLYFSIK